MRGILGHSAYVPYRRLDRSAIAPVAGAGGGKGTRSVASYDEDATTMAVEAGRLALRSTPARPDTLWFATTSPAYADKTNATAIHAALRLDGDVLAADAGGAARSAMAVLRAALNGNDTTMVVAADMRSGLPGSADEATGGDGAAAVLVGDEAGSEPNEVIAEYLGSASATEEFLDRWRTPGEWRSKVWEERFGEVHYTALADQAWGPALKDAGITADEVTLLIVTSLHARAAASVAKRLTTNPETVIVDNLADTVGNTGAAHPLVLLSSVLDIATKGQVIALVSLADGADVIILRATATKRSQRPVRGQAGGPITYGKYLAWRGLLPVEPPRRPEPARTSATASGRSTEWKFGFVGSRNTETGEIRLPPAVKGADPTATLTKAPMADLMGTVATFTVDRLAYSASPPVVFAVVDFDGGGRLPLELTDVDADDVAIGDRVEMTFRRLSTADGIHNYFWKARPVRD